MGTSPCQKTHPVAIRQSGHCLLYQQKNIQLQRLHGFNQAFNFNMHAISDLRNSKISARKAEHLARHAQQGQGSTVQGGGSTANAAVPGQATQHTLAYHLEAVAKIISKQQWAIDSKQLEVRKATEKSKKVAAKKVNKQQQPNVKFQAPPQIQIRFETQQ